MTENKGGGTSSKYWTDHNVTEHYAFKAAEDSIDFLDWRNKCYTYYEDLMPTNQADDLVVLDYGCGPGHDLLGFGLNSKPRQLIAVDVSDSSLKEAKQRLELHQINCEFIHLKDESGKIKFADKSVDLIHSSGVLHHTPDPLSILKEFRRLIKTNGKIQIMVYNYHSLWVHLYVAYELLLKTPSLKRRIATKIGLLPNYQKLSLEEAFQKSTDGVNCPISRFYKKEDFIALLKEAGFDGTFKGAAISNAMEMKRVLLRFEAMNDRRLSREHREFLYNLKLDAKGIPTYSGQVAGIDGCYEAYPV